MPAWVIVGLLAIVFALIATWVARRLLDRRIGEIRALILSVLVFLISAPVALWMLQRSGVLDADFAFAVQGFIALAFLALTLGWMLAIVVAVIMAVEFLWPSRGFRNPVTAFRQALRRRDRARRYAQIVAIGSRHGLGLYQRHRRGDGDDLPTALVAALNQAGVTFVKLGQTLSTREDVLPPEFVRALSTLQMDSTAIPWAEAEAAIIAELGRPLDEVFAAVEEKPLAAASVAQVHAATLLSGEEVVVKIQRPRARAQVTTDLDILERLAADAERRMEWARDYGLRALVVEFARALRDELDYRVEAANTELLRGAIARSSDSQVSVPKVYAQFTTTRMLVLERVTGTPFSRLSPGELPPERAVAIADGVVDAVFEQIAVRGVFHADLHPGNLVLRDDDSVALVDFGAIGVLERSMRHLLVPFLIAILNEDDIAATDVVLLLCAPARGTSADRAALQHDIGVVLTRIHNDTNDQNVFRALIDVLRAHRLAMPPSLLLVFRTLASLEGSMRRLQADYDMVGHALSRAPHTARLMNTPRDLLLSAQSNGALLVEQLRRLPRRMENLGRSLEDGTFVVQLRRFSNPTERSWLDGLLGQVTVTIVGIALLLMGILLAVADGGPELTAQVAVSPFLGSVVALGGFLLLLRSLRRALRLRGDVLEGDASDGEA
ncbi:ubiquinone biosynthesis protein [Microbacterium sp. SLBN-154]|uniref:ABC1 kinase family protein n=1 Tax=Microbacterium sp. SLBN-154 TaxID=2768458 RepID=UPI00115281DA|nr:AarF/UbiB family protein [Microbacterium sp. SLBN-154]TQK20857.1 ubiquinone biosynthesis protein [Microbacterium sp. SLBN-154]